MHARRTQNLLLAALFTALTAVSARISISLPGTGMVFSAQVCVVLCSGLLLGSRFGTLSQALYLLIGLAGVPVFALGGGLSYVLHPTFGYLLGFPAAAAVCGGIASRASHPRFPRLLIAALCGTLTVYAVALPTLWVQALLASKALPAMRTFLWRYCAIFLPLDAVKALLAAMLCLQLARRLPPSAHA